MIQIDVKMPQSCLDCPFSYIAHGVITDVVMCSYLGRGGYKTKRFDDCPLKEVKNDKQRTSR